MNDWLTSLLLCREEGVAHALVTLIQAKGSTPRDPGAKMVVTIDGRIFGTIGGGQLEELVIEDAKAAITEQRLRKKIMPLCLKTRQCCGGSVEVFIEPFDSIKELWVFGLGHVGQAVLTTMTGTEFCVYGIDERKEWQEKATLPHAYIKNDPIAFIAEKSSSPYKSVYAVIMTHSHELDFAILEALLQMPHPLTYLGLIGSTTKAQRFRLKLKDKHLLSDKRDFICPIGTGKLGKKPKEVAISFAHQILNWPSN